MLKFLQWDPRQMAGKVLPILQWSRSYNITVAIGDLIAGITIALTLIPQSIAYASLAGLEPQYGLYASFIGGFVYAFMGTCPQINIGPTALISLLTFTYTNGVNPDFAVLLCFMSGVLELVAGIAQLGFLVDFVSLPVVSGFTSAAAITIASSQIKGLLGLSFKADAFVTTWKGVIEHIGETRLADTLLSAGCCLILIGMKSLKEITLKRSGDEGSQSKIKAMQKTLWFTSVARNAVVVILSAILAFFLHQDNRTPFILTGKITPGLPMPKLPPFHTLTVRNNITLSTGEMFSHLGSGLLVVPLVSIIANVAIAKAFSNGQTLDATQEIIALGACNIVGAFFSSFPINGSFTRSALSDASGVKTPAAGFYTGIMVVLTLSFLTPYFYYIPRAAFAAVITCAVLHMVDIAILKKMWRTNRLDIIPLVSTFIFCLALGIEVGLICGVGVDVLLLLYYHSRPPLDIRFENDGILPAHYSIHPVGGIHFAGAENVRAKLKKLLSDDSLNKLKKPKTGLDNLKEIEELSNGNGIVKKSEINGNATNKDESIVKNDKVTVIVQDPGPFLVVYCERLYRIDYTVLQSFKVLVQEWHGRVVWYGVRPLLKKRLDNTISGLAYCDSYAELKLVLNGAPSQEGVSSDTQL